MGIEAKEPNFLHYMLPYDALRTREWLKHGIETIESKDSIPLLDARRFTAFVDGIALAFFSALNACSYAALIVVDTLADLIKAHPIDACYSASQNLAKSIGSIAGIFFGIYVAFSGIAASHDRLQAYLPINPKTPDELQELLDKEHAELTKKLTESLEVATQQLANLDAEKTLLEEQKRDLEQNLVQILQAHQNQVTEFENQKDESERSLEEVKQKLANLGTVKTELEEQKRALNEEKTLLEAKCEAMQMHMHLLEQKLEVMLLKSEIKRLEKLISESLVQDKVGKCELIRCLFNSSNLENSAAADSGVDQYTYVDVSQDNETLIRSLIRKKALLEAQFQYLASADCNATLLNNKARFASLSYGDPCKDHKFTVHLDYIAKVVGHEEIRKKMGISPLAKALLEPHSFSSPAARYAEFVEALRAILFDIMNPCQKQILLVHMSGVVDHDYLVTLVKRILQRSPTDHHDSLLAYLLYVNKIVDDAPGFFLASLYEKSLSQAEGTIGTKDFLGVEGGNLPNLRGSIQFASHSVAFLRAPTPSMPWSDKLLVKWACALGNMIYSYFADTNNGNGEMLSPEELAFCRVLEERNEAMLVAVHECLFPNVERGRCLLRTKLEEITSSYQALFQPYDGPLYNKIAEDGTFGAMEEKLVEAYCHNDINNQYGCLLPLAIRKDDAFLKEYKAELRRIVGYVKKVYFNDARNEETIQLNYEIPSSLRNNHYNEALMGQRAFLHFFYIAQSEHMMVWLNDKLGAKKLTHFKSQCKDAQDRTGMEALVQETQYAMRSQSDVDLNQTIAHIIEKNVGQCLANKGMAFHGQRFTLGAIVFGYLLKHFKKIPKAFKDCEHLPANEKISGMNVNLTPGNVAEVTHKSANCISSYLDALKFYYHTDVRPVSMKGSSEPSDEFNWKEIDSFITSDVSELPTERKYVLNGTPSERGAVQAPEEDMIDIKRYMSIASEDKLLKLMQEELKNEILGIQVSLLNPQDCVYSYRNIPGKRAFVLSMPLAIKRGEEVIMEAEAYLQVNLSMLKEKRAKNGSYKPPIALIRWAWRLKDVDNQKPTDSVLGIEI